MNKRQVKFCIINTLFALVLFFFLQKSHILPGENSKLFFLGPLLKSSSTSDTNENNTGSFLFINTSYDRMLVQHYDSLDTKSIEQAMPRGNIAIADREKLTRFFHEINQNPAHKYLVCDIIFDHPSQFDDTLGIEMRKTKRLVVAQGGSPEKTIPQFKGLAMGLSSIYTHAGSFSKYRLFEKDDGIVSKSIPLIMYEDLSGTTINPGFFYSRLNGKALFNDFTPENHLPKIEELETIDLGDIAELSGTFFETKIKGKILVLGDFYTNQKKTNYNSKTPGPVLLLNTYLSLKQGSNKISIGLIVFLVFVFLFFSYLVIAPQSRMKSKIFNLPILGSLIGGMRYIIAVSVFSLLIYYIFGNNINLVYMGGFFYLENLVIHRHFHFLRIKRRLHIGKR